jgi:hypothetical protein
VHDLVAPEIINHCIAGLDRMKRALCQIQAADMSWSHVPYAVARVSRAMPAQNKPACPIVLRNARRVGELTHHSLAELGVRDNSINAKLAA